MTVEWAEQMAPRLMVLRVVASLVAAAVSFLVAATSPLAQPLMVAVGISWLIDALTARMGRWMTVAFGVVRVAIIAVGILLWLR